MRQGPRVNRGLNGDDKKDLAEKAATPENGPEKIAQLRKQFAELENEYREKDRQMFALNSVPLEEALNAAKVDMKPGETLMDSRIHNVIVTKVQNQVRGGKDWQRLDQEKKDAYKRLNETATELVTLGVKIQYGSRGYPRIVE
ncbi:MAG: hypothetical protein Q7S75_02965 [bacterium]|nr:hypothetical protein [bacterium]